MVFDEQVPDDYRLVERDGSTLVTFPHLPVLHAVSTRRGGVSPAPYDSLNLGRMSGDDLELVEQNRSRFAALVGAPLQQTLKLNHGVDVVHVPDPETARLTHDGDAAWSAHPEVALSVTTADCVPVFFCDPEAGVAAAAHAGWRGTLNGIVTRVVELMCSQGGARLERIRVGLGPCIGMCCFEVGDEVRQAFAERFGERAWIAAGPQSGKWNIDLHAANLAHLREAGLRDLPGQVRRCGLCTSCRPDLFFSYRRDAGKTGRMVSLISPRPVSP